MLLGPDEVEMKSKIWHEENGSFLKEQEGAYIITTTNWYKIIDIK